MTRTLRETVARKAEALCTRKATTTVPHPVLGDVPTCAECAAWVARMS